MTGRNIAGCELGHVSFGGTFREMLTMTTVEYRPGSTLGVLAVHAGIEGGTGEIARAVAERCGATLLNFWQHTTDRRLHLTSSLFDPHACTELTAFLSRSRRVISLHGHHRLTHQRHVFVGGGNRRLAARLARALRTDIPNLPVVANLRDIPPRLRGVHPANPVNLCAEGGVQLELPPCARGLVVPGPTSQEHRMHTCDPDSGLRVQLVDTLCRVAGTNGENQAGMRAH